MSGAATAHRSVPCIQAKELEERRRRRAELEAKLASSASANARAPADGGSQSAAASPRPDPTSNGQEPVAADTTQSREVVEDGSGTGEGEGAEEREADGDDVVHIGSDGEERQMEDLFRAPDQVWWGGASCGGDVLPVPDALHLPSA